MKRILPLLLLLTALASMASAQSTVTLTNAVGVTAFSPSYVSGTAHGSDGLDYNFTPSALSLSTNTGILTNCAKYDDASFTFLDVTASDTLWTDQTLKGPYLCQNGERIGLRVKYRTTCSARTHRCSYYVTSGTATIQ